MPNQLWKELMGWLCWLRAYSPHGDAREAALPAAQSFRNGLNAIYSIVP